MYQYLYPHPIFRKKWVWFDTPRDVSGVDSVTFFSYEDIIAPGFKKKSGQTVMIDLTQSEEALWGAMRKKFICKQIEKGERNGIVMEESEDFDTFYRLYKTFRKAKSLVVEPKALFEKHGRLCIAQYEGVPVAAGVFITDGEYMRALTLVSARFDTGDGHMREIVGQANRMMVWHMMQSAKCEGCIIFDLGGVSHSSSADKRLAEFKEGFGGDVVSQFYYTKTYNRILRVVQKIRTIIRNI